MAFGERLNSLIIALGAKNITSFEDHIGVSRKTLAKVINKGTDTGCKNIFKIWEKFPNVNLHWLLTGNGNMFIDEADSYKPYPENISIQSVVAEGSSSSNYFREEYINELKDHNESLKLENRDKQSIIEMFISGKVIVPPYDK
ncbi:hypothetical protein CLV62_1519 [Dysgonomonas alginatilytica]|uniref:Bacteriophage CI repressor N-terminal domain-containing protein n=1 Tax=Dysgonomonas alginatilytica TaxID=1605892 RepID=A0A2V3PJJ9_9BACT|nr:helix-turn-helix domain-containing protein [Dysgonomonas alginatilytica]PXV58114.1 hypothetical protein CLV62_1519 [Dysgonomonas alginatilytica]